MMHPSDFHLIARHGTLWMFFATLGERLGLPLFVTPLLVAAGALAAMGKLHFGLLLLVTSIACLAGDTAWYELGRWKGIKLFGLLCRISFQPDSCVRRTERSMARHTANSLLWAKWLPGIAHLVLPVAGAAGLSRPRFHLYNAAGSIAWLAALLAAGYLSMLTIDWLGVFALTARWAVALALVASVLMAARSYWRRRQSLQALRMARISPQELHSLLLSGSAPVIVDLRHPLDFLAAPRTLPHALRIAPNEIAARRAELPGNREIVVYCTCPDEATAVTVTRQLRLLGFKRVRPLAGGLAGWEKLGFPIDRIFDAQGNSLTALDQAS